MVSYHTSNRLSANSILDTPNNKIISKSGSVQAAPAHWNKICQNTKEPN